MRTTAGVFRRAALGSGESHAKRSNHFHKLAASFARAADAMDDDENDELRDCFREIAGAMNGLAWEHANRAQSQLDEAKGFSGEADDDSGEEKAAGFTDLHKGAMPDSVSVIAPDAPGVRPVFRTGQREFVPNARPAGDALENLFKLDSDLF